MLNKVLAVLCSAVLMLGAAGCASDVHTAAVAESGENTILTNESTLVSGREPEYVFTYAENQTEDYPTTQGAYRFSQLVNERTDGRIRILVYANAQLGDENSTLEQLRFGGIDFVRGSLSTMAEYSDMAHILMLPYLYRDTAHMWEVVDGEIGTAVARSFEKEGMVPLSWYDAGVRSFYFQEPVHSLDEMKGMTIRVQPVAIMEDMIRLLGAEPVPIAYENVYSAIQTGRADGAENNWSSYDAMRHNEVAPYYMTDEHMRVPEMQLMSEATWSLLSEEDQQIIRECARESAIYERELWTARETAARERVLAQGCEEITLSQEELDKFHAAVKPLYEKYCGEYMDIVRQIQEGAGAADF